MSAPFTPESAIEAVEELYEAIPKTRRLGHLGAFNEATVTLAKYRDSQQPVKPVPQLRFWWIPQIGCGAVFHVPVQSLAEGALLYRTIAAYDNFEFENRVKPDYANTGGIEWFDGNADGEGEWCGVEEYDDDDFDPEWTNQEFDPYHDIEDEKWYAI